MIHHTFLYRIPETNKQKKIIQLNVECLQSTVQIILYILRHMPSTIGCTKIRHSNSVFHAVIFLILKFLKNGIQKTIANFQQHLTIAKYQFYVYYKQSFHLIKNLNNIN